MSVITAYEIERASGVLQISAGDVVTPLARDRAKELGVRIERAGGSAGGSERTAPRGYTGPPRQFGVPRAASALVPRPESPVPRNGVVPAAAAVESVGKALARVHATAAAQVPGLATLPRSGALYRRGAYGPRGKRAIRGGASGATIGDARPQVAVIGAGHVGASVALRLAESDRYSRIALVDVVPGLAQGLALDIWHGAGVRGFSTRVDGSADFASIAGAHVVVVAAGRPRKPGMTRTDLTAANAEIVRSVAPAIARHAREAVVVVVTNPLEEMTHLMCAETGFPPERVVGMGGLLDAARFRSLVALNAKVHPKDVRALVLGSHGAEMVVLLSQATVGGIPLETLLDRRTLDAIVARTRESGAEVTALLQAGSAFFSPAASIAQQVDAILSESQEIIPACVRSGGAYGLVDTRVGLPVRLGRRGVREIVKLPLRAQELHALRDAAAAIAERISMMR